MASENRQVSIFDRGTHIEFAEIQFSDVTFTEKTVDGVTLSLKVKNKEISFIRGDDNIHTFVYDDVLVPKLTDHPALVSFLFSILTPSLVSSNIARVHLDVAVQSIPNDINTIIGFDTKNFDDASEFDFVLSRYTPKSPGKYLVSASAMYDVDATGTREMSIFKNNAEVSHNNIEATGASNMTHANIIDIIEMDGDKDFLQILTKQNSGAARTLQTGSQHTYASFLKVAT